MITVVAVSFAIGNSYVSKFAPDLTDLKLFLSLGNLVLAWIVPIFTTKFIFKPLAQMIEAVRHIADGDANASIPHTERHDEIGDLARTAQVFKENAQRVVNLAEDQKRSDERAGQEKKKAMADMANTFEANVKSVVDMVAAAATEMDATSRSVVSVVETNETRLIALTTQIDGTTQNMQTVANATSQLSSAVNEINQQINRAASITATTVQDANRADSTVKGLTDAAQKIGEVVEIINSIAAQINLLALNATIEAARAGDAGKGFAVVASEVKNLAAQTTKATEQIGQFINSIQTATGETVGAIKIIGSKIHEINEISTTIAAAVEEQSVSTQEIANNVQQAARGTQEVARNASEVAASSRDTGESAHQMVAATSELSNQSEVLRKQVDQFLAGIRK